MKTRTHFYVRLLMFSLMLLPLVSLASDVTFDVSGSWRLRYEYLENPIFPATTEQRDRTNDRLSSRLLLKTQANWENVNATVEIQDSRAWLGDGDPTLGSSQVNTLEPLQYFLRYTPSSTDIKAITVGRVAIDHGSRRLISKGVYRNAINGFDGILVDWGWQDWNIRALYLQPVSRLPTAKPAVWDNERAFDKSYTQRQLYGVYATSNDDQWKVHSYWFKEDDAADLATRNRDLYTLAVDFTDVLAEVWLTNIEVIGQTGTARATSSASDTTDLDVRSWLVHASLGQKITDTTVLQGELDVISGDNDSSDNTINDFDGLYGVRRFDFGPTDVYQAMPRRNLVAVGARSVSKYTANHNLMLGYKAFWYQQAPEGVDSFIGHQVEARLRWQILKPLRLEFGGAYLVKGAGLERGDYQDNSMYAYTGFLYKF